jgi:hypothetical protein
MNTLLRVALCMLPLTSMAQTKTKQELLEEASKDLAIWAGMLPDEIRRLNEKEVYTPDTLISFAKNCDDALAKWTKEGVSDADTITFPSWYEWSGKFGEIKATFCDKADERIKEYYASELAEHKKLMKNDKYAMIEKQYPFGYLVPGSTEATTDAKALAKANLWFYVSTGEACDIAKSNYTYYRYQFDKEHKLVKTTQKTYCGDPGLKALK